MIPKIHGEMLTFPEKFENLNVEFYYKQVENEEIPGMGRGEQRGRILFSLSLQLIQISLLENPELS